MNWPRVNCILLFILLVVCCSGNGQRFISRQIWRERTPRQATEPWRVSVGRRVVLNCSIDLPGDMDPRQVQYRWERNGRVISYSKLYAIERVSREDAGDYICHGTAYMAVTGQQWNARHGLTLNVYDDISFGGVGEEEDPEITLNPGDPGPMIVRDGEQVYSRCSVGDPSAYVIHWIRRLPDGSDEDLSDNAVLVMEQISTADIQYPIYCEVIRRSDQARFEKRLNIQFVTAPVTAAATLPPELQLTIESLPTEDLTSGKVMRRCRFINEPEINHLFEFRWLDQNGRVFTNGDTLYLTIENLADLGNYTCEAVHQQTAAVYQANYRVAREIGSTASPSPLTQPTAVDSSYRVVIRHNIQEADIGQPYEMECVVSPHPPGPVTYRWMYNNRMVGQDSVLRIPALSPTDLSEYVCKAEWSMADPRGYASPMASEMKSSVRMRLTRDRMIDMVEPPGAIMVTNPGESRELHCEFSHPRPNVVQWFFNGQPMERNTQLNASGQFYLTPAMRVSIISIRNVQPVHGGQYQCTVDGVIKQVTLVVQGDQGLEVSPREETVDEETPVEFHCRASSGVANVNRQLVWYFQPFNSPEIIPMRFDYPDGFLRNDDPAADHTSFISKMSVAVSDEGNYICRLPSQNTEAVGILRVNRRPLGAEIYITPSLVRVRAHQAIDMECYTVNDRQLLPRFHVRDPSVRFVSTTVGSNRIRFRIDQGLAASYNGTVVDCSLPDGSTSTSAVIIIEDVCPQGYRRCRSGQCLPIGRFCDGVFDCDDRSDEDPAFCTVCDPIAKKCEVHRGRPPIKDIFMVHWVCDGEDDCGNGYDEVNCPTNLFASCVDRQFTCTSSRLTIPLAFVCDKDQDCAYGEDEQNCGAPVIEHTSNYRYNTNRGGTVRLECTVRGHPLPRVIWRFNWGCLPENGRFQVTHTPQNCGSRMPSVTSVLTITNVQPGDDGIYNCEALSGSVRAMSNDYFVMLNN